MENKNQKIVYAIFFGAAVAIIFLTVIIVAGEFLPAIKTGLMSAFIHHWIGKSILGAKVFLIAAFIGFFIPLRQDPEIKMERMARCLFYSSVFGMIILIVVFLYDAFL